MNGSLWVFIICLCTLGSDCHFKVILPQWNCSHPRRVICSWNACVKRMSAGPIEPREEGWMVLAGFSWEDAYTFRPWMIVGNGVRCISTAGTSSRGTVECIIFGFCLGRGYELTWRCWFHVPYCVCWKPVCAQPNLLYQMSNVVGSHWVYFKMFTLISSVSQAALMMLGS